MNEENLRSTLIELLNGGSAHVSIEEALRGIEPQNRHKRVKSFSNTIWEELEHMRIALRDIVDYTLFEDWESPIWPDEYWPDPVDSVGDSTWKESCDAFMKEMQRIKGLVNNSQLDLTSEIPWGEGRTYLRQVLLVADHNAYHVSKIVTMRKTLNNWH